MNPILHDLKQFLNTSVPISKNIFTQTIEHIYNIILKDFLYVCKFDI